mmetsp:Transcript_26373/g.47858  ORF Transcript_26373/g.47858 Transcript_26373/m.47858 type:complete len:80 (-) Transcript_26373:94-333(-)
MECLQIMYLSSNLAGQHDVQIPVQIGCLEAGMDGPRQWVMRGAGWNMIEKNQARDPRWTPSSMMTMGCGGEVSPVPSNP